MLLLGETLQQALRRYPRAVATLCGSTRHTYEEFSECVYRLTNGLARLGLEKGDRIAVLMLNCHRFLEIYYACALGGYVIVPLNVRWGAKEFAYALQDCYPKVFMLDAVVAQHLGPFLEPIRSFGVQHFLFASDETPPAGMIAYEELLRRSTSAPPSVELSEDWNGGTHAFVPKFDPADLLKAISRHRVTSTVLVPTMINMLIGEVGEIVVRGPNLMKGYWQKPEETEKALRGGWYHTKDMARQDSEGYLYIVDRKDDMIITEGENVYSTEVEAVLYQRSEILEAVVIGVPDERWGEAIKALVVPRSGVHLSEAEVIAHCKAVLSPYKVPRSVEFVAELPKSGTGKILKSALRERYWMGKERRV